MVSTAPVALFLTVATRKLSVTSPLLLEFRGECSAKRLVCRKISTWPLNGSKLWYIEAFIVASGGKNHNLINVFVAIK